MKPMTDEEREYLKTAIAIYLETGSLHRVCRETKIFLSRVPYITVLRLKSLIKNYAQEIAEMAGAKNVVYYPSQPYRPSGRKPFDKRGEKRGYSIPSSIKFIFE
jgi:hypothetical protein